NKLYGKAAAKSDLRGQLDSLINPRAWPHLNRHSGNWPLDDYDQEPAYPIEHCMKPLLSPDYHPTEKESFMNPMQLEYFRQKLLGWKAELLRASNETLRHLPQE